MGKLKTNQIEENCGTHTIIMCKCVNTTTFSHTILAEICTWKMRKGKKGNNWHKLEKAIPTIPPNSITQLFCSLLVLYIVGYLFIFLLITWGCVPSSFIYLFIYFPLSLCVWGFQWAILIGPFTPKKKKKQNKTLKFSRLPQNSSFYS